MNSQSVKTKFEKYQANNLIPEWRIKYLDVFYVSPSFANENSTKEERSLLLKLERHDLLGGYQRPHFHDCQVETRSMADELLFDHQYIPEITNPR